MHSGKKLNWFSKALNPFFHGSKSLLLMKHLQIMCSSPPSLCLCLFCSSMNYAWSYKLWSHPCCFDCLNLFDKLIQWMKHLHTTNFQVYLQALSSSHYFLEHSSTVHHRQTKVLLALCRPSMQCLMEQCSDLISEWASYPN